MQRARRVVVLTGERGAESNARGRAPPPGPRAKLLTANGHFVRDSCPLRAAVVAAVRRRVLQPLRSFVCSPEHRLRPVGTVSRSLSVVAAFTAAFVAAFVAAVVAVVPYVEPRSRVLDRCPPHLVRKRRTRIREITA